MTTQDLKHIVMGQPGRNRPAGRYAAPGQAPNGQAARGDGERLTWWDLMSDLDPGWLAWSADLDEGRGLRRSAA